MVVLKAGSRPPWVGLSAAVWVQIATGNPYNFPLYSPSLKTVLGFNQQQLTILGVANDIGENVGILPGIACNKLPPWMVLSVGVCFCFVGYGVIWLAVSQTVGSIPYWALWIALVIATNSSAWFGTAVLVTNMRNFPLSRGTVAGILKGYIGLSAAVYTEIYTLVLNQSASDLLLFLTIGLPIICLFMMYFIRACAPASGKDSSVHIHFLFTQGASICLAVYLLTTTILKDILSLSNAVSYTLVAVMAVLLMSPITIPIKMTLFPKKNLSDELEQTEPLMVPSLSEKLDSFHESEDISEVDMLLAEGEGAVKKKRKPKRGEDFKFKEAIMKADFWLLWLVYFLGVGSGVTVLNNLAQIGVAMGVDDTTILLSLFSFCNFLGRLGAGAVSEYFISSGFCTGKAGSLSWVENNTSDNLDDIYADNYDWNFSSLRFDFPNTLYIATALLGLCFGVQFSIMIPTVSELFGLRHFGIIFNFMQLGNPIGALLFSGMLAGYIYDTEADKQGGSSCLGANCFKVTFLVLAGVCGIGTVLSVVLTIRIRPVYQMLYGGGSFPVPHSSNH